MNNRLQIKLLALSVAMSVFVAIGCSGCKSPSESSGLMASSYTSTNAWGDTEIMPPPYSGTSACGSHCGFVVFNNNGAGFMPDCVQATITVRINGQAVATSQYEVLWRYGSLRKGCALNLSSTQKQYANVSGKKYNYTVYFKPGYCPPAGTEVEILIECSGGTLQSTSALQTGTPTTQQKVGSQQIQAK
jgi:hypothetical protein